MRSPKTFVQNALDNAMGHHTLTFLNCEREPRMKPPFLILRRQQPHLRKRRLAGLDFTGPDVLMNGVVEHSRNSETVVRTVTGCRVGLATAVGRRQKSDLGLDIGRSFGDQQGT